jgi:hypothetical protein
MFRLGCPCRSLPTELRPFALVQNLLCAWRDSVVIPVTIMAVRKARGKEVRTVPIIDRQSGATSETGGPRGNDREKKSTAANDISQTRRQA